MAGEVWFWGFRGVCGGGFWYRLFIVNSGRVADWLDVLWEAVCVRAGRPLTGVLLGAGEVAEVARGVFEDFLSGGGEAERTLQGMLSVLTRPVKGRALSYVAGRRKREGDSNLCRDPERMGWERNPEVPELFRRGSGGELVDGGWTVAERVLWMRAVPVYRRLRINEADAGDVYAETVADFLKARPERGSCPFREMVVFEELPVLFGVVAERRAISWVRKQTTLKNKPNQGGVSFDDPDTGLDRTVAEPRSLEGDDPLAHASFAEIRDGCEGVLSDFEWHLLEVLFVEGTQTRDELVCEDEVLEELEVDGAASRSTKLRRLNAVVADALARLGRSLTEADL